MGRPCSLRIDEATLQPRFPHAKCKKQKLKKSDFLLINKKVDDVFFMSSLMYIEV
jgi:hypothetical protein